LNVSRLLESLDRAPALRALVDDAKAGTVQQAGAVVESARPAVIAYLAHRLPSSTVVVTAHPHRAEFLGAELAAWLPTETPVLHFPAYESWPHERSVSDREVFAQRQPIVNRLTREKIVVVTSVRALIQPVGLPQPDAGPLELRKAMNIQVDQFLEELVRRGYEPSRLVEEPGTISRRGGIIDIFPIGASHPVRLELLGSEIDSLRIFDPVNQRSLAEIDAASVDALETIGANRLALLEDELQTLKLEALNEDARPRWIEDIENLRAGTIEYPQLWAGYLHDDTNLLDGALLASRSPVVVLEDPDDIRLSALDLAAKNQEVQAELTNSGDIPEGYRLGLMDYGSLAERIARTATIELVRGGDEHSVEDRVFARPPTFRGRIRDFLHSVDPTSEGSLLRPESALILTSYQHGRLAELLGEEDIPVSVVETIENLPALGTVTIVKGSLAEGWIASGLGLELFTDHEIFGWSKPRLSPRRKRAARDTFFTEFKPDDYVVHIEHGIGKLTGTTKMTDNGIEKEYLVIEYAGTDRIYVPTDQLDRVTRYVGVGEAKPQLSKLGGAEWTRAKARAQKAAEDMAEELIALYATREADGGHAFAPDTPWQHELESSFSYEETPDQLQAITDVKLDMERERPMDRLVVADVGYGKTEVAVRAAFKAVIDGSQVAILVPTTVLGQQHYQTFRERLEAFPVRVEMLSRFRSPKEQKEILRKAAAGELDVVIGTHRLLAKDVKFQNLGLLVVDEEQRFGVRHKERLKQLRATVDVLTLTATPIPRTLHMSLTGIRDVSIIQTPPEGRLPIRTFLQPYEDRLVREALVRELEREGQIYFVHNRVLGIEAVAQRLRRLVPEARILVGHGQMPEDQLEKVMLAFAHQEADVLLCSTIIESGLDIPNVNTIIIDHAESLGLGQLYQLRGRVGRGANQAYAYLLYPRDMRIGKDAMRRMEAVFEATELGAGFKIAMTDLEIRGAGNLLGSEQSGNVAAIGFDLYTSLLKDAIERQRGERPVERAQVTVDLPFDVLIPDNYVPDERERMSLYRRIAVLESADQVQPFAEELRDRFGPAPPQVENLFDQIGIKFLAEAAGVAMVSLRGERLTIRGAGRTLYDRVGLYRRFGMEAKIDENTLRISVGALGRDWLQAIRVVLTDTAALRERQQTAVTDAREVEATPPVS
jgi:transcription-repair coupling factor (superfamily II helicase)